MLVLVPLFLLASGGQCGRPGPGPGGPGPGTPGPSHDAGPGEPAPAGGQDAVGEAWDDAGVQADLPDDPPGGDVAGEDVADEEVFDEEAALAKLAFKKVPKIPKFKPYDKQEVADPSELEYLNDHAKTNKILAEAKWAKVEGEKTLVPMIRERVADGTSYRFRILLDAGDGAVVTGFFKPRQANYWDWLKEIHAYNIGREIDAPTVPTVMRFMPRKKFSYFLGQITPELVENFKWEGEKKDRLRGAFKYWVPSYRHRTFGKRVIGETYMTEIAKSLHPANKKALREGYDLYLQLGRGIVFDYLIINEDRPENLGTILMPDGSYHMVLIDNGLSLGVEHGGRTVMKNMFKEMRIFPRHMIDRIRALDEDGIWRNLRPEDDQVMMLPEVCVKQLWKRRQFILERVDELHQMYGDVIWY
jgi:hypothetical protein